jgi:hypothetical protein
MASRLHFHQPTNPEEAGMTLVKPDRPRRIDRVIDYFGDTRHGASGGPRTAPESARAR